MDYIFWLTLPKTVEPGKTDTLKVLQTIGPIAFTDSMFNSDGCSCHSLFYHFYSERFVLPVGSTVCPQSPLVFQFLQTLWFCVVFSCVFQGFVEFWVFYILTEQASLCVEVISAPLWLTFKLQLAGGAAWSAEWCHCIWQASGGDWKTSSGTKTCLTFLPVRKEKPSLSHFDCFLQSSLFVLPVLTSDLQTVGPAASGLLRCFGRQEGKITVEFIVKMCFISSSESRHMMAPCLRCMFLSVYINELKLTVSQSVYLSAQRGLLANAVSRRAHLL